MKIIFHTYYLRQGGVNVIRHHTAVCRSFCVHVCHSVSVLAGLLQN